MSDEGQRQIEEINLLEIGLVLKKSAKPIILTFLVAILFSGIHTYFFVPKKYQSSITFYLQEKSSSNTLSLISSQLGGVGGLLPDLGGNGTNADLCSEIILSRDFLENVLKTEGLPYKKGEYGKLKNQVSVIIKKSNVICINVLWENPQIAYRLTNRIFNNYKKFIDEQVNNTNSLNRIFLEEQFNKSKERLAKAENALLKYQKANGVLLLPDEATKAIEYFADLEKQRLEVGTKLSEAKQRLEEANSILEKKDPQLKSSISEDINPIIKEYKAKLIEIELQLAKAKESLTDDHPTLKSLSNQREELLKRMDEEKDTIHSPDIAAEYLRGLIEVTGLETREVSLDKIYFDTKNKMAGLPNELYMYGQLIREQKVAEQIYMLLISQYEQAKVAEAKEENVNIVVIDRPVIPGNKYSPSISMNMVITGMTVLLLSGMVALFREFLSKNHVEKSFE